MRFSITRCQFWMAALAAGATFSTSLEAAQPKTANGNAVVRASAAQEEAEPPSVMRRSGQPASSGDAEGPVPTPGTPGQRRAPRVADEIIHEGALPFDHAMHGGHPGHGFGDMYFNEGCFGASCKPCSTGPVWIRAEYLLWWRDGLDLPNLVTTSPSGTPLATAGEFGQSSTTTLFGGEREEYPVRPGGRVEAGLWCDSSECIGVGGRFFWLGDSELSYTAESGGSPILAIPFTEGATNTPDARVIGFPATFGGDLDFRASSEIFGGDAYGRMFACQTEWCRVDVLAGYQYARINEGLVLDSTVTDLVGGATNQLTDTFDTTNEFHGGLLGVTAHADRGCFYVDLLGKVALGNMDETVNIRGRSVSTVGATTSVLENSGLFAQATNIGTHKRSEFVAIPEVGANLGWRITDCIDIRCGYTLIIFSGVTRPGDAIDTTVNTTQIGGTLTGPARPEFEFVSRDLIVHGLNLGLTVKW